MNIEKFVTEYEIYLKECFEEVWKQIDIEPDKLDAYSVVGALLSRQITLSIELARSPNSWNFHSAPLYLRGMTDLYITLSWILLDMESRAEMYIKHGLGEQKLLMELYKEEINNLSDPELIKDMQMVVDTKQSWINSQKMEWAVEVNLGNWAPLDYRKMSQEAKCEDLYKFAYKPFSQVSHNMWPHVSIFNSKRCTNPLHKHHLIPELIEPQWEPDYMYRSCKYVDKVFNLFIDTFGIKIKQLPVDWWNNFFTKDAEENEPAEAEYNS